MTVEFPYLLVLSRHCFLVVWFGITILFWFLGVLVSGILPL